MQYFECFMWIPYVKPFYRGHVTEYDQNITITVSMLTSIYSLRVFTYYRTRDWIILNLTLRVTKFPFKRCVLPQFVGLQGKKIFKDHDQIDALMHTIPN